MQSDTESHDCRGHPQSLAHFSARAVTDGALVYCTVFWYVPIPSLHG